MHNEIVEITVIFKHETSQAILINDGDIEVWIPKSQIENYDDLDEVIEKGHEITIEIPEWLAIENDLI